MEGEGWRLVFGLTGTFGLRRNGGGQRYPHRCLATATHAIKAAADWRRPYPVETCFEGTDVQRAPNGAEGTCATNSKQQQNHMLRNTNLLNCKMLISSGLMETV